MLKLAKEYNVRIEAMNPSQRVREKLPLWYHTKSDPSARSLYRTKVAKCLRKAHRIQLVEDATALLERVGEDHTPTPNCKCGICISMRATERCSYPNKCIAMMATLLGKIHPVWNPTTVWEQRQPESDEDWEVEEQLGTKIEKGDETPSLKEAIWIFGDPEVGENHKVTETPDSGEATRRRATAYTDGACLNNGSDEAQAGCGVWYGDRDPRNISERVPHETQSNQTGELMAVLLAVKRHDLVEDLQIVSDSKFVVEGLMKHLKRWEQRGWVDVSHGGLFKTIVAWARWRKGETYLKWTKGHSGTKGNEEADRLAGEGARKTMTLDESDMAQPPMGQTSGATLANLGQRDFYKILRDKRKMPTRTGTDRNVKTIQESAKETFGVRPTQEKVWMSTKHRDLTRKTRDFLWKSTQNAYKIGYYWTKIDGYQERGICPICDKVEDMEHILTKCEAGTRKEAWRLANSLWAKRHPSAMPNTLGGVLGCGLASFKTREGKPDTGKNRLYRIVVSETAYLIWKLRNERRIQDDEGLVQSTNEVIRWTNTLNKRLTIDRMLTNKAQFRKNTLDGGLVKSTWRNCLRDEEDLPTDWPTARGVLVGMSVPHPPGCEG